MPGNIQAGLGRTNLTTVMSNKSTCTEIVEGMVTGRYIEVGVQWQEESVLGVSPGEWATVGWFTFLTLLHGWELVSFLL